MPGLTVTFNDPVADSPHIKKDVERAIQILQEEGYQASGNGIASQSFQRAAGNGQTERVEVYQRHMNGTMAFHDVDGETNIKMAWDYIREMRPTKFQQAVNKLKHTLGL